MAAFDPLTFVYTAVVPVHLAVTVPQVKFIPSFVDVSRLPLENTVAMFGVPVELPFILVAIRPLIFLPLALAMSQTILEGPCVYGSIAPSVLTVTVWDSILILPLVLVTILKNVGALTMLQ